MGPQFGDTQDDSTFTGHEPIELTSNGSLQGQVTMVSPVTGQYALITDLRVSFITDNRIVAETRVNPDGTFTQANLLPGVYSMVVAGKDGIGYMGVDVVGGLAHAAEPDSVIPVRMTTRSGVSFGILQGAGASSASDGSDDSSDDADDSNEPADDGGTQEDGSGESPEGDPGATAAGPTAPPSGGSVVGGGGTGGSGGGLTALGLAGGAAIAFLASDDDDGRPASPAR